MAFVAHLRFIRKVDHGRIRTRCPIIDILCSVGCLLKMMMSPSHMCRSTWHRERGRQNKKMLENSYRQRLCTLCILVMTYSLNMKLLTWLPCSRSEDEGHLVWGETAGRYGLRCLGWCTLLQGTGCCLCWPALEVLWERYKKQSQRAENWNILLKMAYSTETYFLWVQNCLISDPYNRLNR